MTRLFICCAGLLTLALTRTTAMAGEPLPAAVAASAVVAHQTLGHPRLFFTADELAKLRALRAHGEHARIWNNLRASADWCLTRPLRTQWIAPQSPDPIHENLYDRFYAMMHDMAVTEHLAFAWAYSGDERYGQAGSAWLMALCRVWIREADGAADTGKAYAVTRLLKGIAVGYDLLYDTLSAEQRQEVRQTLLLVGGKYHQFFSDPKSQFGPGYEPHHGSVEAASMGLTALALIEEEPQVQPWLELMVAKHQSWLLPQALTRSGTHNQTSNFWISIMQYRCAFIDALRRSTGRDLFQEFAAHMPITIALAAAIGPGAGVDEVDRDNVSWLLGPSYGQINYAAPVLVKLAREYRNPTLQHLARWDPSLGALQKSRYITPHGEHMLFDWGGYAYAWYDADLPAQVAKDAPLSALFCDPDPNPETFSNEAYARTSFAPGALCVAVQRGAVVAHAGGQAVLIDFTPAWPPLPPLPDLSLRDDGHAAVISCTGVAGSLFTSQTVTLTRRGLITIERSTSGDTRFRAHGRPVQQGPSLLWPDGVRLTVKVGSIVSFDPAGYVDELIVGMGLLKLPEAEPVTSPLYTVRPDAGQMRLEISAPAAAAAGAP